METNARTATELLATQVQFLKGVGPARAPLLERLGLRTARDVLFYFPRDYQDLTDLRKVEDLEEGAVVSVLGKVEDVDSRSTGRGRTVLGVLIRDTTGPMRALWFNLGFMHEKFRPDQQVLLSGKVQRHGGYWQMTHPRVEWIDEEEEASGRILPMYALTEGLAQGQLRRIVAATVESFADVLEESFSDAYMQEHGLAPIRQAIAAIHFPPDRAALDAARRRFVYQELFILQLALSVKRRQLRDHHKAPPLPISAKIDARIRRLFPFELTAGQRTAIDEVAGDMGQGYPMNRLLQGDVGTGKTVVAVYAMLLAVAHGFQAVLMAPTEVLARQHDQTLRRLLAESQVRRGLLTGSLTAAQRRDLLKDIAAGEMDIVVGTQAMLEADVEFSKLGLVVIDEQHKFGVRQRAALKRAGLDPHYLVMTATPIPRTMLMSAFGDLDVSVLSESPPGRQMVHTYLATAEQRAKWWDFFRKKLSEGRQGYVITPLIDETETRQSGSLSAAYESLANGELEAFRLGLVHGRMTTPEKEAAMEAFRRGDTQVLVATTVIEVGVDVPNATLMTIEGAEWFGLSQLHQLRGRISRGSHPGYCCAFTERETDDVRARLQAFVDTTDGFKLAEIDYDLRGPGDLLGTKQHGMPAMWIADLKRDSPVLEEARRDALALVERDPGIALPEHARLRRLMIARYGQVWDLGDVG